MNKMNEMILKELAKINKKLNRYNNILRDMNTRICILNDQIDEMNNKSIKIEEEDK